MKYNCFQRPTAPGRGRLHDSWVCLCFGFCMIVNFITDIHTAEVIPIDRRLNYLPHRYFNCTVALKSSKLIITNSWKPVISIELIHALLMNAVNVLGCNPYKQLVPNCIWVVNGNCAYECAHRFCPSKHWFVKRSSTL